MRIDVYCKELGKENNGIKDLILFLMPKGRVHIDLKKKLIIVENFKKEELKSVLNIIERSFNYTILDVNSEKKFKIPNEEKAIQQKKEKIKEGCMTNPLSLSSRVKKCIFEAKVFTLVDLKKEFPDEKENTIRAYVNDLKKEGILLEIRPGKYALL